MCKGGDPSPPSKLSSLRDDGSFSIGWGKQLSIESLVREGGSFSTDLWNEVPKWSVVREGGRSSTGWLK